MTTKLYRLNQLSDVAFYRAIKLHRERLEKLQETVRDDEEVMAFIADKNYWYYANGTLAKEENK